MVAEAASLVRLVNETVVAGVEESVFSSSFSLVPIIVSNMKVGCITITDPVRVVRHRRAFKAVIRCLQKKKPIQEAKLDHRIQPETESMIKMILETPFVVSSGFVVWAGLKRHRQVAF